MKYLFSAILAMLLLCANAQSQPNERKPSVTEDLSAKPGTYQLVFKSRTAEEQVSMSHSQLVRLEQLRDQSLVKYVQYSDRTLIKLLPKEVIENPSFAAPAKDRIYIVEEADFYNYSNLKPIPLF